MMDTLHVLLLFLLLLPSTLRGAVPTDQPPAAPSPYTAAGRAQLRAQHDAYFPLLAARAADIAKQADPYSFVSLRPNKISNGGWGNVLWFYMETLAMAMATNRHAVFNNAVLSALFAHPNEAVGTSTNSTSTSTSDTANWHVLSNAEVTAQQQRDQEAGNLTELMPCGHVARRPVAQWGKHFFVHGCFGNNLMHPDVKPALGALLQLQPALDIEQGLFADMAFAHMMRWMLSNPRPLFRAYAEEKVRRVQELCAAGNSKNNSSTRSTDSSSNNSSSSGGGGGGDSAPEYDPIDLAVQIRVFRDNNANNVPQYLNGSYARDVYHSCALQAALAAQQRKATAAGRSQICVFVTSDSHLIADDLRTYLHGHPGFNGTVVTGADVSPHTADWLSIAVLKGSQDKANETEIAARPEFSDWHVVSAALAAVSTDESSFSASARYRSGYFHARHDLVASKNDTGVLGCTRKFNWEWMCQVCLKMGASKCPDDVRQDCHGGGGGGSGKRRRRVLI